MVTISYCPIPFHDGDELVEFLNQCGKYKYMFDGADVFLDGQYCLTIRIFFDLKTLREVVSYQKKLFGLPGAPVGDKK